MSHFSPKYKKYTVREHNYSKTNTVWYDNRLVKILNIENPVYFSYVNPHPANAVTHR